MYIVHRGHKLFDASKRWIVYDVYDVRGRYKSQCSMYHNFGQNMHGVRGRINILNRHECLHVYTVCDVRGRYVRFDCMYSDN